MLLLMIYHHSVKLYYVYRQLITGVTELLSSSAKITSVVKLLLSDAERLLWYSLISDVRNVAALVMLATCRVSDVCNISVMPIIFQIVSTPAAKSRHRHRWRWWKFWEHHSILECRRLCNRILLKRMFYMYWTIYIAFVRQCVTFSVRLVFVISCHYCVPVYLRILKSTVSYVHRV